MNPRSCFYTVAPLALVLALSWFATGADTESGVAAKSKTNSPAGRPRSLREARERNGIVTTNKTFGLLLRDKKGGLLPDPRYEGILLEVVTANVNHLVNGGAKLGGGAPTEGLAAQIGFRLNSKGELSEIRLVKSDMPESHNQLALRAMELSSPLPPWPNSLQKAVGSDAVDLVIVLSREIMRGKTAN